MTDQNIISNIEKYLYKLRSKENNIDEYYSKELRNLTDNSKVFYLIPICKLFETDEQRNRIQRKKELNPKPIEKRSKPTFKYPDGEVLNGIIIDEIRVDSQIIDENTTGKTYSNLVQKIKLEDGRGLFRFCYYYINFDNENPKWIFGQYALALLEKKYKELINKMKEKGWL